LSFACTHGPLISSRRRPLFSDQLRLDRHALWLNTVLALRPGPFLNETRLCLVHQIWSAKIYCSDSVAFCLYLVIIVQPLTN
jgi:hypothetical protein